MGRTRPAGRGSSMLVWKNASRQSIRPPQDPSGGDDALASLDAEIEAPDADYGRPSIPPERLIRASLIQILFSVRSERQLMEQLQYNLLFRWFVVLGIDDVVWGEGRQP